MELSIDTSTNYAGIALSDQSKIIAERTWHSKRNHTIELIPAIQHMLDQMKIELDKIQAIFVAKGPGSFNGLRVGLSTAKGFALALSIPIVAISTLEIEAYHFAFTRLLLCSIHNAGRGEIAAALYRRDDHWKCIEKEHITTTEVLCQKIREETIFCGEIPGPDMQYLQQALGKYAIIPDATILLRHASHLAALGWQRLSAGIQDNPESLQPIYLRKPPITQRKVK